MEKIGIIGSSGSIQKIEDINCNVKSELNFLPYNDLSMAVELIDNNKNNFSAFLFLGPTAYFYCKEIIDKYSLTHSVLNFDHYVLTVALFKIFNIYKHDEIKFSLDIFRNSVVEDVINDLGIDSNNIYTLKTKKNTNIENIVDFHKKLWDENKIDFVVTGVSTIYKALEDLSIPCYKVDFSIHNYKETIQELDLVVRYKKVKLQNLIIGTVIVNIDEEINTYFNYDYEKYILDIHKKLIDICYQYNLTIYRNNNVFKLIGTNGSLRNIIKMEELLYLINNFNNNDEIKLTIGFGSGETSIETDQNSLNALDLFDEENKTIYLVTNYEYTALLSPGDQIDYSYIFEGLESNYNLIEKNTFSKYLNYINGDIIKVKDYTKYAQISYRTGIRFFNKLVRDEILIETIKNDKKIGRPPKIYKLKENL